MDANTISVADSPPNHGAQSHISRGIGARGAHMLAERRSRNPSRVRVTRACDRCKKRKTRCTGLQPCRLCSETFSTCTYNAAYYRGRLPVVQLANQSASTQASSGSTWPRQVQECHHAAAATDDAAAASPQVSDHSTAPSPVNGVPDLVPQEMFPALSGCPMAMTEADSQASPEPTQTDMEGHYVGPSSGVAFLLRVQKRLDQSVSFPHGSPIFNFGDAPLPYANVPFGSMDRPQPYFDPTFYLMLSREDTTPLVQRYFEFAVPVDRFLHRPTIEHWLDEFYNTRGAMHNKDEAPARTAVLFMLFAIAQEHMTPKPTPMGADMSARYFLAANQQLSRERGIVRLASVQARLCQCLWLLSQSRINHCWSLFGTVARFAFAIGLHRNRHGDFKSMDQVEVECRRRTFWSAYSLDNYLSTALGRPRTFHNDDIDQELPSCIDDYELHPGADQTFQRDWCGQSVMRAPVAYSKLSRILSRILRDIYTIRPASVSGRYALITKYTRELKSWRSDMSAFLDLDMKAAPLVAIFQRQRNVLNLAYWHTMILTHRPLLLSNFARLKDGNRWGWQHRDSDERRSQMEESIRECLQAAMSIVRTVHDIIQAGQLYQAFWFTPYFAFSAAVMLYVYTIQRINEPEETYRPYFAAAESCQNEIAGIAEDGSLTARYCLVLEELRAEVIRQTDLWETQSGQSGEKGSLLGMATVAARTLASTGDGEITGRTLDASRVAGIGDLGDFNVSPSDSLAELTGWNQFDAMVASGVTGLESLLGSDRFTSHLM